MRSAHVALGVDRVVVAPIRDRAAGDANLEALAVGQRVAGHETAVAPTPNANATAVNIGLALEPGDSIFEIAQFELTEVFVDRPRRFFTLAAGSAIVTNPDDVALLRQRLVKQIRGTTPGISDLRRVRPTIGERHHRILLLGIEVGRLDHHRFHYKAVARFHLQQFRLPKSVLPERLDFVLFDDAHQLAVGVVQTRLRRRVHITPEIYEEIVCRTENESMRARRCS